MSCTVLGDREIWQVHDLGGVYRLVRVTDMEMDDCCAKQWGQRVGKHPCLLAPSIHHWISIHVWLQLHLLNFWSCFFNTDPFPQAWHRLPAKTSPLMIFLGLCVWCNDSCEECSISERSGNGVIHRLAATLHKAHCWNTDFNLLVLLRPYSAIIPAGGCQWWGEAKVGFITAGPYPKLPILPCQSMQRLHLGLCTWASWTTNASLKVATLKM